MHVCMKQFSWKGPIKIILLPGHLWANQESKCIRSRTIQMPLNLFQCLMTLMEKAFYLEKNVPMKINYSSQSFRACLMSLKSSATHCKATSTGSKLAYPEEGSYLAMVIQLLAKSEKHSEE